MAPELGIFSLILAFVLSLSQAFFGLAGAWRGKPAWMAVARPAVTGQFVFVGMAFACMVLAWNLWSAKRFRVAAQSRARRAAAMTGDDA